MMNNLFNPLEHPITLEFPLWLQETAWAEHIPFAMYLMGAIRPRIFVELGSFRGVSYCAFCQAVKALSINSECYAIDTWQGDSQAGMLEDNVLGDLRSYHDPLYGSFSHLIRSTFDDALAKFEDHSIDLLHIDGFHTYEAVSHDFNTWLPKMSDRGIVLFHDTNVRERDFGVWKFWSEVAKQYPHFEFLHGHGLGVLAVGEHYPEEISYLFKMSDQEIESFRNLFYHLGLAVEYRKKNKRTEALESYERAFLKSKLLRIIYQIKEKGIKNYLKTHPRIARS